ERARSHEQLALADAGDTGRADADADAAPRDSDEHGPDAGGEPAGEADSDTSSQVPPTVLAARSEWHRAWSRCHQARAAMREAAAAGDDTARAEHERLAGEYQQQA